MRQLRYLQPAGEPELLVVETADGGEQFNLQVDPALRDAVRVDPPRPGFTAAEVVADTTLGPREIQMRVRAGADPQDLADEHRLPLEKIMRFAGPVLEERVRIAEEARRARARRTTTDGQTVIFGESVDARFAAHGIDPATVRWDARRREDAQWLITATWLGGQGEHSAEWVFQLSSRHVAAADDTAADLLSDKPIRPLAPPEQPRATPPPLGPGVFAFPAMPNAHTGPLPKVEEVFDQEAPNPDAPRVAPAPPQPAAAPVPAAAYAELPLPLAFTEPLPEAPAAVPQLTSLGVGTRAAEDQPAEHRARARHRERSKVPTWDDIMLGVRRKQD